jgi:OOP family OmpA-OmpF porin
MGNGRDIPAIPQIVVPDVRTLTRNAVRINEEFGPLASPGQGLTVTGAVCDTSGRIRNGASLTVVGGDGSGLTADAQRTAVNDGHGAGVTDDASSTVVVHGDGSGTYNDAGMTIAISNDGSGVFDTAQVSVVLHADGSGSYEDAGTSIVVHEDGSGVYRTAELVVINHGDGSGSYETAEVSVVNKGDGTGTYRDASGPAQERKMDALPPLHKAGAFPPVASLKPLGSNCGTLIRLEDRVLFDFDSATLRPSAAPILDAVAKVTRPITGRIQVNGHTDAVGSDEYNNDLSTRRAQAIAQALADRHVTAPFAVKGFGESQPVAANQIDGKDYPAGRQLNRRVDLLLPSA